MEPVIAHAEATKAQMVHAVACADTETARMQVAIACSILCSACVACMVLAMSHIVHVTACTEFVLPHAEEETNLIVPA